MTLKPILAGLAILLALPAAGEPFRLIVTSREPPLVPNSVQHLAKELGYFDRAGVDVDLVAVQQTPMAVAALRAGEGDMANISTEAALLVTAQGQIDLRAVISPDKAIPFLIAGTEALGPVADLRGARFAVSRPGGLDHTLSRRVLDSHGVDIGELEQISVGRPAIRAQALAAGRVDATTISIGTWLSLPDREGLRVMVPPAAYFRAAPLVSKVNVVTARTLAERPGDVAKVLQALVLASRDFAERPELWIEAMAKARPDVPRTDLETMAEHFAGSWSVNGGLDAADLAASVDFLFAGEDFDGLDPPRIDEWVAFGPLDSVLAELGNASGDPASR